MYVRRLKCSNQYYDRTEKYLFEETEKNTSVSIDILQIHTYVHLLWENHLDFFLWLRTYVLFLLT